MKVVTDNFNKAYPDLASQSFTGTCYIDEHDNDETDKFQQAVLTGLDGYKFPHELMRKASSFASMAGHKGVLTLDCDQVVLFEREGQKYILLCELKSSYICDNIVHAKDQIVVSSVKMQADKKYSMPAAKTDRFFKPLEVGDIDLYYVAVPDRKTTYTIDISTLI